MEVLDADGDGLISRPDLLTLLERSSLPIEEAALADMAAAFPPTEMDVGPSSRTQALPSREAKGKDERHVGRNQLLIDIGRDEQQGLGRATAEHGLDRATAGHACTRRAQRRDVRVASVEEQEERERFGRRHP